MLSVTLCVLFCCSDFRYKAELQRVPLCEHKVSHVCCLRWASCTWDIWRNVMWLEHSISTSSLCKKVTHLWTQVTWSVLTKQLRMDRGNKLSQTTLLSYTTMTLLKGRFSSPKHFYEHRCGHYSLIEFSSRCHTWGHTGSSMSLGHCRGSEISKYLRLLWGRTEQLYSGVKESRRHSDRSYSNQGWTKGWTYFTYS